MDRRQTNQRRIISTTKQAIRIELDATVGVTLTLKTFIWLDQLVFLYFSHHVEGSRCPIAAIKVLFFDLLPVVLFQIRRHRKIIILQGYVNADENEVFCTDSLVASFSRNPRLCVCVCGRGGVRVCVWACVRACVRV